MDKQIITVRQSTIGDMELCPARQGQKDKEGYADVISEQATYGTVQHEINARLLRGESIEQVLYQNFGQFVETVIDSEYERHNQDRSTEADGWADTWTPELIKATIAWQEFVTPFELEPLAIEGMIETSIYEGEECDIVLQGTPDLVEENGVLWDWKTSGRGWKDDKAEGSIQAPLYRFMVDTVLERPNRQFNYLVWNRRDEQWDLYETYPSPEFIDSALARAIEYGRMVYYGVYPATPLVYKWGKPERGWYCSKQWCGAWDICPFKNLDI